MLSYSYKLIQYYSKISGIGAFLIILIDTNFEKIKSAILPEMSRLQKGKTFINFGPQEISTLVMPVLRP